MAKAAEDMEGMEAAKLEGMGEEMMEEMMRKFEDMGEKVTCLAMDQRGGLHNTEPCAMNRAISRVLSTV
jgi:hypothetical protein